MADQAPPSSPRDKVARSTPASRRTLTPGDDGGDDRYVGLRVVEQIEVRELIGVGSMARVYRAFQHGVDRDVAVKILHRELSDNPDIAARFHREAQVACLLDHPNAVKVLLTSQLPAREKGAGELVLVMEYLRGRTLADVLGKVEGGKLSPERAVHVLLQICDVVGEAHRRGVVHRDLKPENVMLVERGDDPDFVKVLDFGLARLASKDASYSTRQGAVFGSPRYISPEGAQGVAVTPAADVYSLATIFFQCLAGRTPFEADTPVALLVAHATEEAPPVSSVPGCEKLPEPLVEVLQKNLSKSTDERDPDAGALGRALARAAVAAGLRPDPVGLRLGWVEVVAEASGRDAFSPELRARIEAEGRGKPGMTMVAPLDELPFDEGNGKVPTLFDVPSSAAVRGGERGEGKRGAPGPTLLIDPSDPAERVAARAGRSSATIVLDPHDGRPVAVAGKGGSGRGVIPAVVGHSAGLASALPTPPPPASYFGPLTGPPGPSLGPHGAPHHAAHGPPHGPQGAPPQPPGPPSHGGFGPASGPSQAHMAGAGAPPSSHHAAAQRPNPALSSTPGASVPTDPSHATDEPRRRYGLIAGIVGVCFALGGALSYSTVRLGHRRGESAAAEGVLVEVQRAEQRGAWFEPPGRNVRELLLRAQRDLPGDRRVLDLRRSLAGRALEVARGERNAGRAAEAQRYADLAREFDPGNVDAITFASSLGAPPADAVPMPPSASPPPIAVPAAVPPSASSPPAAIDPPPGAGETNGPAAARPPRPPPSNRPGGGKPPSDGGKPGGRAGHGAGPDPWL
jgi:serine/threonine-protein kinase